MPGMKALKIIFLTMALTGLVGSAIPTLAAGPFQGSTTPTKGGTTTTGTTVTGGGLEPEGGGTTTTTTGGTTVGGGGLEREGGSENTAGSTRNTSDQLRPMSRDHKPMKWVCTEVTASTETYESSPPFPCASIQQSHDKGCNAGDFVVGLLASNPSGTGPSSCAWKCAKKAAAQCSWQPQTITTVEGGLEPE